jgi:hypothetical protein
MTDRWTINIFLARAQPTERQDALAQAVTAKAQPIAWWIGTPDAGQGFEDGAEIPVQLVEVISVGGLAPIQFGDSEVIAPPGAAWAEIGVVMRAAGAYANRDLWTRILVAGAVKAVTALDNQGRGPVLLSARVPVSAGDPIRVDMTAIEERMTFDPALSRLAVIFYGEDVS